MKAVRKLIELFEEFCSRDVTLRVYYEGKPIQDAARAELDELTRIANIAYHKGGCQECEYDQLAEAIRDGVDIDVEPSVDPPRFIPPRYYVPPLDSPGTVATNPAGGEMQLPFDPRYFPVDRGVNIGILLAASTYPAPKSAKEDITNERLDERLRAVERLVVYPDIETERRTNADNTKP